MATPARRPPTPTAPRPAAAPAVLVYRASSGRTVIDFRLGGLARRGARVGPGGEGGAGGEVGGGGGDGAAGDARARAQEVIVKYLTLDAPGLVRLVNRDAVLDVLRRPWANPGFDVWADGAPLCDEAHPCVLPHCNDSNISDEHVLRVPMHDPPPGH